MGRLQDSVAIVTGGAQGVGLGIARALAAESARVVIANRSAEAGRSAAETIDKDFSSRGGGAAFIQTDVGDEESVRALVGETVERFGRVDVLINNATPSGGTARVEKMRQKYVELHIRVNYYAALWAMQAAFPHMKAQGHGRVINLASLSGVDGHPFSLMYNASKEALRSLTRTAAAEWSGYGITCNVICPLATSAAWEGYLAHDPEGAAKILERNPSGRVGDPECDIGPLAVFLASEESRYVTGNTIHADGGGHINGVHTNIDLPE